MLDIDRHRAVLTGVLLDLYRDHELAAQMVFKGGTCLMLFYGLDRFSTDLDFDLREGAAALDRSRVDAVLAANDIDVDPNDPGDKHFGHIWIGSYAKGQRRIKLEVSRRSYPAKQRLVFQTLYGQTLPTLAPDLMLAHKLCAILERSANRDLYDAYFCLKRHWHISADIVRERTGMTTIALLQKLYDMLEDGTRGNNILHGLGEVLSESQKDWAKRNLLPSLKQQLAMRILSPLALPQN
jgi:predicted nucleotidyltransferase component of viral defense system